jgi:hypothetical protein
MSFRERVSQEVRHDDRRWDRLFPAPGSRAAACRKAWGDVLVVSCYRIRPTPPAVRVTFPKSPIPLYSPANDRAARDLSRWLARAFPNHTGVHAGEPADRTVLQNLDWVIN